MDYQKAKDVRGKSLSSLITDRIVSGGGIGSSISQALSEKSKARMTGLKEKFDPLNIVKALTGGSRLAPAILGRLTGRSPEAIKYFAGDTKNKRKLQTEGDSEAIEFATKTLGSIYTLMLHMEQVRKRVESDGKEKQVTEEEQEEKRNQELIKALTARRAPKKKVKKDTEEVKVKEKKQDQTKRKEETKKVEDKAKKEVKAEPVKPKKLEPQKVEVKPEVKPTAKPEIKPEIKPTAKPVGKMPPITGDDKSVMNMVKKHEGVRTKPYKDSLGLWTVGVGHLIGDGKTLPKEWDREFSMEEVDTLFAKDYQKHKEMAMRGPGWDKANDQGKAALIDLTFNMGEWWRKFKKAAASLESGDFNAAADQLQYKDPATKEPSKWYQQVKGRAVTIVDMIRGGKQMDTSKGYIPQELPNKLGNQINSASTENRELKKEMDRESAPVIVNNNRTTQTKTSPLPIPQSGDDRSAYSKKAS